MSDDASVLIEFMLSGTARAKPAQKKGHCLVTLRHEGFEVTARGEDMSYTLASGMQVHVKVAYVDAAGNPAVVDGDVAWSSSDEKIATVTVEGTDRAVVKTVGPAGQAQVIATADADLGQGVRQLVTPMDVTVVAGEAVAGAIAPVGAAEPIP